jgi:hypothetical protein
MVSLAAVAEDRQGHLVLALPELLVKDIKAVLALLLHHTILRPAVVELAAEVVIIHPCLLALAVQALHLASVEKVNGMLAAAVETFKLAAFLDKVAPAVVALELRLAQDQAQQHY